jgi:hypothetical protein
MSFSDLKKQSKIGSLTAKLVKEVEKLNSGSSSSDDRLWKPEVDKAGNGYAVIRFLPAPDGEEYPWVKVYNHAFQGTGGWLIDTCLTTVGAKCPVCESNSQLWNSGSDANKEIARSRKRKLSYYSNIYVVKDPSNPQNEGKIFLYKYGQKIFDKIQAAMKPEFEDETPINPFDFWQGADFKLKIKKVAGYWNYDSSEFTSPSVLLNDDEALEALWKTEYSLAEFHAGDKFKSYEQLKTRLDTVLGNSTSRKSQPMDESYENEDDDRTSNFNEYHQTKTPQSNSSPSDDEEDEALSYFQKLVDA